ncbi:MAG: hypothetical protein H5U02_00410 [Clostridia bacterium]|nr:hypothetical protein [Clostridia bacterium]
MRARVRRDEIEKAARKALAGAGKQLEVFQEGWRKVEYHVRPVLFAAGADRISVSGWDLDAAVMVSAPAEVEEEGQAVVDGGDLAGIAARIPEETAEVELKGEDLVLRAGAKKEWRIRVLEGREAPDWKDRLSGEVASAEIETQAFQRAIVAGGRWYDKGQYWAIGGVLVEADRAGVLNVVSSDRYRLAWASAELAAGPGGAGGARVLVPGRKLALARMFGGERVALAWGESWLFAADDAGMSIWWRGMEYAYPDYARVVPSGVEWAAECAPELLEAAARRALVLGQEERGRVPTMRLSGEDGGLVVSACGWVGDMEEKVGAELRGRGRADLNARYLIDLLEMVKDMGKVRLEFSGRKRPLVVRERMGSVAAVYVVMTRWNEEEEAVGHEDREAV